jgi:hypothetical protein
MARRDKVDEQLAKVPLNTRPGKIFQEYNKKGELSNKVAFVAQNTMVGDADTFRTYKGFNVYDKIKTLQDVATVLKLYKDNSIDWMVVGGHGGYTEANGEVTATYPGVALNAKIVSSRMGDDAPLQGEGGFSPESGDISRDDHFLVPLIQKKVKPTGMIVVAACGAGSTRNDPEMKVLARRLNRKVLATEYVADLGLTLINSPRACWRLFTPGGQVTTVSPFVIDANNNVAMGKAKK